MTTRGIPDDVAQFIRDHIDSIELLEVLLLLRERSGDVWSAETVARELRINPVSTTTRLEKLTSLDLLADQGDASYRYAPATSAIDTLIQRVAECYRERRVTMITMIFSKPSDSARDFADAFRLRKKEE